MSDTPPQLAEVIARERISREGGEAPKQEEERETVGSGNDAAQEEE